MPTGCADEGTDDEKDKYLPVKITIMTDEEIIAVVTAHKEGKQIQQRSKGSKDWNDTDKPNWNFYVLDYRVKPESKYRSFKNVDEAFQEAKKHGFWIKRIDGDVYEQMIFISNIQIITDSTRCLSLYNLYVWADDDTPCGVLEE